MEERFGPFREWRREFDELQNLLGHAEDGAAVGRKIEKVAKGIERARGAVTRHEEAREGRAALVDRAEALVPRVVHEKDLSRAREQLRAALDPAARGGPQELRPESLAARLEAGQPALGPLRGRQWAGFETPERRDAVVASRNLAEVLRQVPAAQAREARAAGPARGATRRLPALEARAEELANLRYQHRPTKALLTRVRDLAIRVIEREARKSLGAELSLFQALRSAALGSVWRTVQGKAMAGLTGPLSPGLELLSFALKIGRALERARE